MEEKEYNNTTSTEKIYINNTTEELMFIYNSTEILYVHEEENNDE